MGEVYRARDTRLGRDVAVETLSGVVAGRPERLARFEREARLLASLNHPHVGSIYGVEDASGHRFRGRQQVQNRERRHGRPSRPGASCW
jgi:eukaryotic-like serine/threonine-protein kinase